MIYNVYMIQAGKNKHGGFTLAEVLITVGLIGVVAAITLPTLVINVQTSTLKKRATIESRKFTQALENMVAFDDIAGKGSTEKFVEALGNYLKISKICLKDDIKSCWPTEAIKLYDGSGFGIDQAQSGKFFLMKDNKTIYNQNATFNTDNVAIITHDGTPILLSYNTSCRKYDEDAAVNCVVGLFDSNGAKGPNRLGQDVVLLNAVQFAKAVAPDSNSISCLGNSVCFETTSMANVKEGKWFEESTKYDKDNDSTLKNGTETTNEQHNNTNEPETCGGSNTKQCNGDFSHDVNTPWR